MADEPSGHGDAPVRAGAPIRSKPLPLEFPGVHYYDEEEIEAVSRVLRSRSPFRYYGVDPQEEADAFEREFAGFVGVKHALAVSSCTGALHVALSALGVGPGQEVIIPAYLWVSVIAAVVNRGAIPVLADIDETFCMDPASVEAAITDRTAGIVFVHMSGAAGRVDEVAEIARRRGLFLMEDCAQCLGGSLRGRKVGTFGRIAVFSFQVNKNMTAGEGGCIVTDDETLYRRAVACHDLGYAKDADGQLILDRPDLHLWGMGYRLDELRAAVLRVQLRKLPRIIGAMRKSKYRIREAIAGLPGLGFRKILDAGGDTGCFLITIYPDAGTAERVNRALRAEGIITHPQGVSNIVMKDWGLHLYHNNLSLVNQSSVDRSGAPWRLAENLPSAERRNYAKGACPVADDLFERSILLPIPSCLTREDEDDIIGAFRKVLGSESPGSEH